MAGYRGYSMSNNAINAYRNGEMPFSKWTKDDILNEIENIDESKVEFAKQLTAKELKDFLLARTSWHHTSNYYNKTDFYSVDENRVDLLNQEQIDYLKSLRVKKVRAKKEIIKPTYITAYVTYSEWEGSRKHPKLVDKCDIVQYMSIDKMIKCYNSNNYQKRLSSVYIKYQIEQKTKFATKEQLIKKFKISL